MADRDAYRSAVGSLLHLAQCTRPDVALAVGALSSYVHAPSQAHWDALLDVVRYVGHTAHRGITYGGTDAPVEFFCDANFATCLDTRRSVTGYVVVMYGGAVSWASKKQATTAASTQEAEYQACGSATREALSFNKAQRELGLMSADFPLKGPLTIRCDNEAALSLVKDRKEGARVKHIDVIHHLARERVASGEINFLYCVLCLPLSFVCLSLAFPSLPARSIVNTSCIVVQQTTLVIVLRRRCLGRPSMFAWSASVCYLWTSLYDCLVHLLQPRGECHDTMRHEV